MVNHCRNKAQSHWAGERLAIARKQFRRRNAIPATKAEQRKLAAEIASQIANRSGSETIAANSHRANAG
jgi:hypothetical protein